MSERKVLNKYYPPDFDPSKIPKVKGNRNATFIIRVMAPCNMRCTTCGEYIYKVQIALKKKSSFNIFSSREENSMREKKMWTTWIILGSEYTGKSDLPHVSLLMKILGCAVPHVSLLWIFLGSTSSLFDTSRFYIKCTACVSEICFRTDPESCDYVLEAGDEKIIPLRKKYRKEQSTQEIEPFSSVLSPKVLHVTSRLWREQRSRRSGRRWLTGDKRFRSFFAENMKFSKPRKFNTFNMALGKSWRTTPWSCLRKELLLGIAYLNFYTWIC